MLSIIIWYLLFIHNYRWHRPQEIGLGIDLKAVASVSASRFWPRLTSLGMAIISMLHGYSSKHHRAVG